MSYNILNMWRSAQSVIGNKSKTTQYDDPMVAATASPGSHLVCFNPALRPFAPPGLPLFAPSAKWPRAATGAGAKSRVHSQSAAPVNWSRAGSLPAATAAHQPGRGRCVRAMVGTKLCPWLRGPSTASSNASFNTIRIAAPQPSWPRFTGCWLRREPTPHH